NLAEMMTVHESYLAAALSQIDERYASVDAWLEKEYQLTPQAREALQSRLLEG
ncbi:tyrosine-protein phosphatase, partial [Klebsiella michiganensis]